MEIWKMESGRYCSKQRITHKTGTPKCCDSVKLIIFPWDGRVSKCWICFAGFVTLPMRMVIMQFSNRVIITKYDLMSV